MSAVERKKSLSFPLPVSECVALVASERWKSKVTAGPTSFCWMWTGSLNHAGYGQISVAGRTAQAHRVAATAAHGVIPAGRVVDHLCRNRACVNPDHLQIVTSRENTLRGNTITAQALRRTHCPQGHPLSGPEAELVRAAHRRGERICRVCSTQQGRARSAAISAAKRIVGMTHREYVSTYGSSLNTALQIIEEASHVA